ncbi:LUD domain-containing protein [Natrinema sp. SYSU A 869]|uniref:LUD domain-containing protein n=1 Tax=Natrinema sp. SYSU A 869 TaxID=2871694 RepID=UPI0031F2E730
MTADTVINRDRFEVSLADLDVPVTHSDSDGLESTLESIVSEPVIGTSLPFEEASLPDWIDDSPTPATLEAASTSVTAASLGIAEYGSVVLPAKPDGSEQVSLFPDLHVPILRESDLVSDMPTAINRLGPALRDGGSAIVATGPSATADMGRSFGALTVRKRSTSSCSRTVSPMSDSDTRRSKAAHIRHLLETEGEAVEENTLGFNQGRYESVADLEDYESLKSEARAIKKTAIERLPDLIDELTATVEGNGGTVYLADDAADANRYIREVARERDANRLVKSKSMTSEELEVNEALEGDGVDVVETDLGEWVLQVADEAPSHIVAPAIHRSEADIARLFNEQFDPDEPLETAEELTAFAREELGGLIREADIGMTGANFITADSGTMALVTSEGNARKTAVVPDTHVAVAGVEKIVPSVEDLSPFIELIGRSGTGQDITSYISLLTPPVESPVVDFEEPDVAFADRDDDREFHLVLIDNGRMEMREDDQLRETLYCIRCSACANSCANFQSVGGHAFGGETYSGGIATGWEAGVHGYDSAAEFNDFCTGCSRCVDACPVEIDIPWINTVVRDRLNGEAEEGQFNFLYEELVPDEESGGIDLQKRLFGNYETLAKLGSATAPVSNWLASSRPARKMLERIAGVDGRRELPTFQRETLRDWYEERGPRIDAADADREVVLYPDTYTNHIDVDRGKATVRVLERLNVHVRIPDVAESGRAPLSQGMIDTADERASRVYASFVEHLDADRDVVVIEPSDLAMFHREYEKLLPEASFERLRDGSYEILEYVYGCLENGADADTLPTGDAEIAYHSHCQQRTLGLEPYTTTVLEEVGYDVLESDVECCGMAGSFGYKSEYYELSMDVGDRLREQFTEPEAQDRIVVASGTSCEDQLGSLLDRDAVHPVELLDPRRRIDR